MSIWRQIWLTKFLSTNIMYYPCVGNWLLSRSSPRTRYDLSPLNSWLTITAYGSTSAQTNYLHHRLIIIYNTSLIELHLLSRLASSCDNPSLNMVMGIHAMRWHDILRPSLIFCCVQIYNKIIISQNCFIYENIYNT